MQTSIIVYKALKQIRVLFIMKDNNDLIVGNLFVCLLFFFFSEYVKRVIVHPAFKNISFKDAERLLAEMDQGECIVRPSSKVTKSDIKSVNLNKLPLRCNRKCSP